MRVRQFVAYYRVSTAQQGCSGLGLEAQREAVRRFIDAAPGALVAEFTEVRSARSKNRPQLIDALRTCRVHGAVLVIARLDRLSRNAGLIADLVESGLEFVPVDFTQANRLTIHILAAVAEYEAKMISERTKAALAAAKARGAKLGGRKPSSCKNFRLAIAASVVARRARAKALARDMGPSIWPLVAQGMSPAGIAGELNRQNIPSPKGRKWHASSVVPMLSLSEREFALSPEMKEARLLGSRRYGTKLRALKLAPTVWQLRGAGMSLEAIAGELNRQNIETPKQRTWHTSTVWKLLHLTETEFATVARSFVLVRSRTTANRAEARTLALAPMVWELRALALQLRLLGLSESMGHHDSEIMDGGRID